MRFISALGFGLLFGLGLIISDMVNPAKVLNFLDLFGTWDPSLAFVMGGAIAVGLPGFWLLQKMRNKPVLGTAFAMPTRKDIDQRLLLGTAFFGIGWGLGGFCPGPALTALPLLQTNGMIFVAAMITGMMGAKMFLARA